MTKFTKDQLIERIAEKKKSTLSLMERIPKLLEDKIASRSRAAAGKDLQILEIALAALTAGMEQEPVAEISQAQEYDLEGHLRHQRDIDYYQDDIDKLPVGTKLYAAPQLPQPAVVSDIGEVRVGRLPTMNQDEYPGLGDWWVQLRIGNDAEEVLARVYGSTPQEANCRAEALASRAAMLQGAEPVQGWIPCRERMPENGDEVLCAKEFDGPGDWRKKVGYYLAGKWTVYGASWAPTHWMPLPAAPQQEVKR